MYSSTSNGCQLDSKGRPPFGNRLKPFGRSRFIMYVYIRGKENDKYGCSMILCYQILSREMSCIITISYHIYHLHPIFPFFFAAFFFPSQKKTVKCTPFRSHPIPPFFDGKAPRLWTLTGEPSWRQTKPFHTIRHHWTRPF